MVRIGDSLACGVVHHTRTEHLLPGCTWHECRTLNPILSWAGVRVNTCDLNSSHVAAAAATPVFQTGAGATCAARVATPSVTVSVVPGPGELLMLSCPFRKLHDLNSEHSCQSAPAPLQWFSICVFCVVPSLMEDNKPLEQTATSLD